MTFGERFIHGEGPGMEQGIPNILSLVNGILALVSRGAQGMEIGGVERQLLPMLMAVGRAALEGFVAEKGTGYTGKEIADAQGNRYPYVRDRICAFRSIFGTIPIRRAYYHADASSGVFPLDGELNVPERGY
jgi:hypothetical protein